LKSAKDNQDAVYLYRVSAPDRNYTRVEEYLISHKDVKGFDA